MTFIKLWTLLGREFAPTPDKGVAWRWEKVVPKVGAKRRFDECSGACELMFNSVCPVSLKEDSVNNSISFGPIPLDRELFESVLPSNYSYCIILLESFRCRGRGR